MKVTKWYRGDIKPVRSGWYDVQSFFDPSRVWRDWWDNDQQVWRQGPKGHIFHGVAQINFPWRGIAR